MALKKIIPTGTRNLDLLLSTATVGTFHGLPLHSFSSNLQREERGRDYGREGR